MSQFYLNNTGGGSGSVVTLSGNDSIKVGPDGTGNISIIGAPGVDITGNAPGNQLTVTVSQQDWVEIPTTPFFTRPDTYYWANTNSGHKLVLLPLIAATTVGQVFAITNGSSLENWQLGASELGNRIQFGSVLVDMDNSYLQSFQESDTIYLVCVFNNGTTLTWEVVDTFGNIGVYNSLTNILSVVNNSLNIIQQGLVYNNGIGLFSGVDGIKTGYNLISNGTGVAPQFQNPYSLFVGYKSISSVNSPYTAAFDDNFIAVNTSTGPVTINMPVGTIFGAQLKTTIIKDSSGNAFTNNITVTTTGGVVTFDGQTSLVMDSNYQSVNLANNGTFYNIY